MKYLGVFADRRMFVILLLGFSSGLPFALTGSTLQAWLSDAKLDIGTIGLFALAGLPYTCKFLWAPFLDHYALPFLGLRRGWGVVAHVGLAASIAAMAFIDPVAQLDVFAALALVVAFFSASLDIVIDAYRTEILEEKLYGAAAGIHTAGYRIAYLVSGGATLIMADHVPWKVVYLSMAALALLGGITLLFAAEPKVPRRTQVKGLKATVVAPFVEFFRRDSAMEILLFVMIYKLSTMMAVALTTKYLLSLEFSKTVIGSANKGAGLVATIAGTLVGGSLMVRMGLKRSLWIFGLIQSLVGLTFWALPYISAEGWREIGMFAVISIDNFMMGLGAAALMGFMMQVISKQFTGTQFALLASLTAVTRVILAAHAGTIVEHIGWGSFFLATVPLAIPGLLLLRHFDRWQAETHAPVTHTHLGAFDKGVIACFMLSLLALSSDPLWRWLNMKSVGENVVFAGAAGILAVVAAGLAKPYLGRNVGGTLK